MADRRQLVKYLRFQLDELSAENGHHNFEHICREVARARLATNLIPATGPVAGGGDAGRDFETFKSYLPKELGEHSAFVANMSDEALAFACTLQKEQVDRKFKKDVDTIVASGDKFDQIYAMCAVNVEVGRRNRLRKKVLDQHGMDLTLFDGQWLAEQLADPDLFWVAEAYLSVPAHLAPAAPRGNDGGTPEWYGQDLAKWQERGALRPTLGDVLDARDGLRYATFHQPDKRDLDFWLQLFEPLTATEHPRGVRQRARYEYAIAALRGAGALRPADDVVRAFFDDALPEEDAARLKDASVLLNYAVAAYGRNLTDLDATYLRDVHERLRDGVRSVLDADPYPTQRAMALEVLGHLSIQPDPANFAPPQEPQPIDIADYVDEDGDVKAPSGAPPDDSVFFDVNEAMAAWSELAGCIEDAPLFPVDGLSKFLNVLAPALVDRDGWRELTDAVDAAVRRSAGNAAAAAGARTRALRLLEAGRLRDALDELHSAKVDWWTGDNFEGALLMMLLITDIYRQLGMMQASKHYALAVSFGGMTSSDDDLRRFVPRGLLAAADPDFSSGAWCNAVDLYELAFVTAHGLSETLELNDDNIELAMLNFTSLLRGAAVTASELEAHIQEAMRRCGMEELIELSHEMPEVTAEEVVASADVEMHGRPFSDAGEERVIRFSALGLDWTIRTDNTYEHVLVAERFAAAAQVLLVELANKDLCFLRTAIDVRVKPSAEGSGETTWEASNDGRKWTLTLMAQPDRVRPGQAGAPEHDMELLAALTTILLDASLLPRDDYMAELEVAFRRGLPHKLGAGRPYDELVSTVVSGERFDGFGRRAAKPPADPAGHPVSEHPALAWQCGPGPTYSRETAEELLRNRYEVFAQNMRYTLPRLLGDEGFRDLITQLRAEGWKDWHIALAVFSRTHSLRISASGYRRDDLSDPATREKLSLLAYEPEQPGWPTPPARLYTREDLDLARQMGMLKLPEYWSLELRQATPDFPAIESFFAERYAYWSDDIEHEDPFPATVARPPRKPAQKKTRARRS